MAKIKGRFLRPRWRKVLADLLVGDVIAGKFAD